MKHEGRGQVSLELMRDRRRVRLLGAIKQFHRLSNNKAESSRHAILASNAAFEVGALLDLLGGLASSW